MSLNNRYELRDKLGSGGMGVVYMALDRLTGTIVALKRVMLSPDPSIPDESEIDYLTAMATEFRTLAGLRHPHVIRVMDYGFTFEDGRSQPYFTMEYLPEALTITRTAAQQPLQTQVRLLVEMLLALAYLHRRGVIHRDLKPDNVLVDSDGRVRVLDFGLAMGATGRSATAVHDSAAGTIAYMAPELFADDVASVRSDLYAAGMIACEIFTGAYPFNRRNLMLLLGDITTRDPDFSHLNPNLGSLLASLMAKNPSQRPGDALEVIRALCAATGQPVPVESTAVRESFLQASRFVGRSAEMNQLKQELDSMLPSPHRPDAPGAQVYLIGGESGVGKSRLLDEIRARALVKGALVLRGQGIAEGGLPYQLWRDIAQELALHATLSDLEVSILRQLVPGIGTLLGRDVLDAPELAGSAGSQRLVLTLVDMLRRPSQPILLLLEDLQWAVESLLPVRQIISVREQLPRLLILGTYRDDERPDLPDELPGAGHIQLHRLDNNAIAELAHSMLGDTVAQPQLLALLQRETEGNAFFMVETVRALAEEAGALSEIGRASLPQHVIAGGIEQITRRRLLRVPESMHRLLRQAAVVGRQLDLNVLARSAGVDRPQLEEFLTACDDAAVLEIANGGWRFSHDKLRETILHDLPDDERHRFHRDTALAIEAVYPGDGSYQEILLEYWRIAEDVERELFYLVPVVERLVDTASDYQYADRLAQRGLALMAAHDARRLTLLNFLSYTCYRRGDYIPATVWADEARQVAARLNDYQGMAQSLNNLGQIASDQNDPVRAGAYFNQSLDINRAIGNKRGIAEGLHLITRLVYRQGDLAAAVRACEQSLALAREIGFARSIALNLNSLGYLAFLRNEYATARDYYQQSLDVARATGDQWSIGNTLNNLGFVLLAQQEIAKAAAAFYDGLMVSHQVGAVYTVLEAIVGLARCRVQNQHPVEAAELAGMIDTHPATIAELRETVFANLQHELSAVLPMPAIEAAMEHGRTLRLEAVVQKLLAVKSELLTSD